MGVGAYVYCRCWQDGLAIPAPVGPVGIDQDGRLGLLKLWDRSNADEHGAVEDWLRHGCPHEDMRFAHEDVGAWAGVRIFQQTLREAGTSNFPRLLSYLPRTNDGWIPAAEVPAVLTELDYFENRARLPDKIVLVDEATGDGLYSYIEGCRGVFVWGRDYDLGVDPDGFFVVDKRVDPPVTLFRTVRFEQRVLPGGELEFADSGRTVRLEMTPIAGYLPVPPQRLAVQVRPGSAADFAYLLGVLRRLCAASLTTGNPVNWI
ncbi:hypothetical protein [Plantactinospora endophytica]|uniref:hypothetical protein n=1 Tax=Plantactinospora endophytica TaxID=673535 RepID=UPI001942BB14|nr:hypothetical protein [Plantactinospora endophytica]